MERIELIAPSLAECLHRRFAVAVSLAMWTLMIVYKQLLVNTPPKLFDAEGRRVRRIIGGQETWHVHGIGGELLAEYGVGARPGAAQKEYGYRNGQLLVVWDGGETGDRQLQWLVQDYNSIHLIPVNIPTRIEPRRIQR